MSAKHSKDPSIISMAVSSARTDNFKPNQAYVIYIKTLPADLQQPAYQWQISYIAKVVRPKKVAGVGCCL